MKKFIPLLVLILGSSLAGCAQVPAAPAAPKPEAAPTQANVAPAPTKEDASAAIEKMEPSGRFQWKHLSLLERAKQPMGVLFLGDSITEGWNRAPHIWDHYYGMLQPANFGISGDRTQHVIWRIEHGELDHVSPKVVVLMLGTNNAGAYTGEEIAAADKKIVELIRAKVPTAKVLLLAIFPRGPYRNAKTGVTVESDADFEKKYATVRAANVELAKLDDGQNVRFLDIGPKFLGQDGKIPLEVMPDQLHPSATGYQIWADAMQPLLTEMLK